MNIILFIIPILFTLVTIVCSVVYLYINNFTTYSNIDERNKSLKRIIKYASIGSLVSTILYGLLNTSEDIEATVSKTSTLYMIIGIAFSLIIIVCIGIVTHKLIKKDRYEADCLRKNSYILKVLSIVTLISYVLSWLLS